MFPNVTKYAFVNGSPCQDLTIHSANGGTLGITGSRSVHFFAIVAALIILKTFALHIAIWLTAENAGSMAEHFLEHFLIALGLPADKLKDANGQEFYPHAMQIDARQWAHVRRSRFVLNLHSTKLGHTTCRTTAMGAWLGGERTCPESHYDAMVAA